MNNKNVTKQALSNKLLANIDAYWRAANYLSVGQIYLYDNPLLKRPLKLSDIKRMLLGYWGTTPGQNFIYVHLNRIIKQYDLIDHCLLLHPEQTARIENKLPAYTVGSLQRKSQMDVLLEFIKTVLEHQNPAEKLKEIADLIDPVFQLMPSGKHMVGRYLGRMEPTASLQCREAG